MKAMEDKILTEGRVLPGDILMLGSFLNQQIDTVFLREMGREIARLYDGCGVTKILTIESSGIAVATAAGMEMGVPLVFAKKHRSGNVDGTVYSTQVHSYTHGNDYMAVVGSEYLGAADKVLLVDDFLANGEALHGLMRLARQAGAEIAGAAIAVEKGYQRGGRELRGEGLRVESLAIIESMGDGKIAFRT